jgi:biotin carboxylase
MGSERNGPSSPPTLLCLAGYEKGHRFLQQANKLGCRVFLLTSKSLQYKAKWPRECLEDVFYMPDEENQWNLQHMVAAVSHLCRTIPFDRIVALDDFDVEKAALLREHLRLAGRGESASRFFRDKLAMRMCAAQHGIPVPEFTAAINYEKITRFLEEVTPPWVLKPRLLAGAHGIKKAHDPEEIWHKIHSLGDRQSYYLLERFVPGDIYHVDSVWYNDEPLVTISSAYGTPPLEVTHSGGIFTSSILERGSELDQGLRWLNERVLRAFQLETGVSHTEFIRANDDGSLYFLETSARVGGAHISDLIEAATGMNLWEEWANIEVAAATGSEYCPPELRSDYAGLLVSLARHEWPDTTAYSEPELIWRLPSRYHVGFIVKSPRHGRVAELLEQYAHRVRADFHASAPPRERPHE